MTCTRVQHERMRPSVVAVLLCIVRIPPRDTVGRCCLQLRRASARSPQCMFICGMLSPALWYVVCCLQLQAQRALTKVNRGAGKVAHTIARTHTHPCSHSRAHAHV